MTVLLALSVAGVLWVSLPTHCRGSEEVEANVAAILPIPHVTIPAATVLYAHFLFVELAVWTPILRMGLPSRVSAAQESVVVEGASTCWRHQTDFYLLNEESVTVVHHQSRGDRHPVC